VGRGDTPYALQQLLAGIDHVDVSESEAREVLAWARAIDGWNEAAAEGAPLHITKVKSTGKR
jgi:hypothetical protein